MQHNINMHEKFNTTVEEWVGSMKAFQADIGESWQGSGTLDALLAGFEGCLFVATLKKTKDKNDPDKSYTNIVQDKVRPAKPEELEGLQLAA